MVFEVSQKKQKIILIKWDYLVQCSRCTGKVMTLPCILLVI